MSRIPHRHRLHLAICLLILAASIAWSLLRGQDANWDLQNYHEYDPFVLLHWRYAQDVAPAGPQGFLNPLPYLLPYGLHRLLPPLVAQLLVTASQSVCLMLAWCIAWTASPRPIQALAATAVAITGPVVLIELGTSFADLVLSIPPLAAILLILRAPAQRSPAVPLLAGVLTGFVIGIKPTGLFLLPALAAFAAMRQDRLPAAARSAAMTLAGAVAGGLLSDGAWALFLWRQYGSPMFPFMNTLFRSHSAALVDFGDPRYHFMGWRHALSIPFALAAGSAATGEIPIRDGRLAFAACLALIRLLARLLPGRRQPPDVLDALCAYVLIGMAGWLVLCPIERYAAVLEMLSGLLCILLIARLPRPVPAYPALLAAGVLLIATTRTADYFHHPWSPPYRPQVPAAIPAGATYGLLTQPLAYWVAAPPRPAHAFGLTSTLMEGGGVLQRRLDHILHDSGDRLWLLNFDEPVNSEIRTEMSIHGISLAPPCLRAASMVWIDTVFCRGILTGPRAQAASDLHIGERVSFSSAGYGLIYELAGFNTTDADATWALGRDAVLVMHLDPQTRTAGAILSIRMAGLAGVPVHRVTITADDARPQTISLAAPSYYATAQVCIPRQTHEATTLVRFTTPEHRSLAELGISAETRPLAFKLYDMSLRAIQPGECPGIE